VSSREDWMRRLGPLYGGAVALVHSTPWRWPVEVGGDDAARSSGWVVALGLPIGIIAYLVAALAKACGLPIAIAGILGLAALTAASAALIERGLVERLDRDAERTPSVAGILVLVFLTAVRIGAVVATPPASWLGLFVTTAVVGRWAAVFLQSLGEPILDDDSPRSLVATPAPLWLTAALSGGVLAIAVLALGKTAIVVVALTAAISFALGLDAQRRDRGLTSPVVACAAAVGELAVLLIATIHS
jgi:cobalamin synthase